MNVDENFPFDEVAIAAARQSVFAWYDTNARALPWRTGPAESKRGLRTNPYLVWLSEIMLQQTTVVVATPYFQRFLDRFPSISALAAAPLEDVLSLWAGLGYYTRARNLHACARIVLDEFGGCFPETEAQLKRLPGIGDYTSAAIAAIAFNQASNVVDGNIERVMARLIRLADPLPGAKPRLAAMALRFVAEERPGDWAQALMDIGATVCTPRNPKCEYCPLAVCCAAKRTGDANTYPRKLAKSAKPTRYGIAFLAVAGGHVLLRRRPSSGLLGGMTEVPSTPWVAEPWSREEALDHAPLDGDWYPVGDVGHVFSHFSLSVTVLRWAGHKTLMPKSGFWLPLQESGEAALPSVMRKIVALIAD